MKKRFVSLLILLCVLCFQTVFQAASSRAEALFPNAAGNVYVHFGSYPQWIDGGTPKEETWNWSRNKLLTNPPEVAPTPILWRVLECTEDQALLLSEYVLFAHPVHTNVSEYKKIGASFEKTQLSQLLNGTFLSEAFTPEEQALLLENEAGCRVSLLTAKELNNKAYGLGTKATRKAWATEYAIRVTDVFVYQPKGGQHTPYWLQDQASSDKRHARCTKVSGEIGHIVADRENEGVRPVIRLYAAAAEILSGSGTMEDPYILRTETAGTP